MYSFEQMRNEYRTSSRKPKGKRPLGRPRHRGMWTRFSWLRIGSSDRHLKHGKEPLGSVKWWRPSCLLFGWCRDLIPWEAQAMHYLFQILSIHSSLSLPFAAMYSRC
jgi:hypothetical protein